MTSIFTTHCFRSLSPPKIRIHMKSVPTTGESHCDCPTYARVRTYSSTFPDRK